MKTYKIKYQDNMTAYYLNEQFLTENKAWQYIEDNDLNNGYSFYNVEEFKINER